MAIEPNTKADRDKMSTALQRLAEEDPTFRLTRPRTGQPSFSGMGELHLDIIKTALFREFNVGATAGKSASGYRETITKSAEAEGSLSVSRVSRSYGHAVVTVEPGEKAAASWSKTR